MSKNYAIIIQFVLPLTTLCRSWAQKNNVYKQDAFVTSWRFHNRAWQPQRHDRLPETSGTLWIHRGALTNQRCSLATGCGITTVIQILREISFCYHTNSIELITTKLCTSVKWSQQWAKTGIMLKASIGQQVTLPWDPGELHTQQVAAWVSPMW